MDTLCSIYGEQLFLISPNISKFVRDGHLDMTDTVRIKSVAPKVSRGYFIMKHIANVPIPAPDLNLEGLRIGIESLIFILDTVTRLDFQTR